MATHTRIWVRATSSGSSGDRSSDWQPATRQTTAREAAQPTIRFRSRAHMVSSFQLFSLDHPAGLWGAGVAGRLGLEIVLGDMDDNRFADDGAGAGQGQMREGNVKVGNTGLIRVKV